MSLEDRHVIPTPEGVSMNLVLAGLGSRFAAFTLDVLIQVAVFVVVVLGVGAATENGGQTAHLVAAGVLSATAILDFIGYFILCELLWSGRSIGKRASGTRVVRLDGAPVGFWASLLRNLMRLIDMMPSFVYLVGSVLILATPKNQRLGDILGGTLVIRERQAAVVLQRGSRFDDPTRWVLPAGSPLTAWPGAPGAFYLPAELSHWDVSAVPEAELTLIRRFLGNRQGYTPEARMRLALDLASRVWPLVSGPLTPPHPEVFLESVVLVKSVRG